MLRSYLNVGSTQLPERWFYAVTWTLVFRSYLNVGSTQLPERLFYAVTLTFVLRSYLNVGSTQFIQDFSFSSIYVAEYTDNGGSKYISRSKYK